MKLSIHTTITNPERWRYPYMEALASFCELADEVIVVDGGSTDGSLENIQMLSKIKNDKIKIITLPWPEEYSQGEFPKHLNAGLEACTGDWAMKMDIDYVIHEDDIEKFHVWLEHLHHEEWALASYLKFQVLNQSRGYVKARLPFIIHKSSAGESIRYGVQSDNPNSDWSYPVFPDGEINGVPTGKSVPPNLSDLVAINVWNYDYFFRTKELAKECFARAARGWKRGTGKNSWGTTPEESLDIFVEQARSRLNFSFTPLEIKHHPRFIRDRVRDMTPAMFGYDNWGLKPL